jgi:RND family efflux transporter MFP subunit
MSTMSTILVSILTAAAATATVACNKAAAEHGVAATADPAVEIATASATEGPTPDLLTMTGKITADQRAEVTASTQGKVLAVMVERGQRVQKGDIVVQLDVKSAALSRREATAQLDSARADRELATVECKRATSLLEQGAITRSQYDQEHARCTSSISNVAAAEARTANLSKSVSDGLVRAPFDGVVVERQVTAGEWVSPGRSLFTLVDNDPLRIDLSVPESGIAHVELGQAVSLTTVAHPGKVFTAKVTRLGAEIGKSRALTVEATLDRTPDLVPGMFAEASIVIGHTTRTILPEGAVVKRGKLWHAFVVTNGELEDRIVQLGPAPGGGQVSILQGIASGDTVAATITDATVDGLKVR